MTFREYVDSIPAISSHEHIGSLSSVGMNPLVGFVTDARVGAECGETGLKEILTECYILGALRACGMSEDPQWPELQAHYEKMRGTGLRGCLDLALRGLYGTSLDEALKNPGPADEKIRRAYAKGLHAHSRSVFAKANILRALKPVQISYLMDLRRGVTCEEEQSAFIPVMRIDEICEFPFLTGEKAELAAQTYGFAPGGVDRIDRLIDLCFELADELKIPAIKQLQAYSRTLRVRPTTRSEASRALTEGDRITVQDYALGRILEMADARGLPYQIHTGMSRQSDGSPMEMCPLFNRYKNVKFVLLHAYPYVSQCGYLAHSYPNVYVDAAWQAVLSPEMFESAMREWIGFVPAGRIFLSADATCAEQCYGAYVRMREGLARVLEEKTARGHLSESDAAFTARRLLAENTAQLYGIG